MIFVLLLFTGVADIVIITFFNIKRTQIFEVYIST